MNRRQQSAIERNMNNETVRNLLRDMNIDSCAIVVYPADDRTFEAMQVLESSTTISVDVVGDSKRLLVRNITTIEASKLKNKLKYTGFISEIVGSNGQPITSEIESTTMNNQTTQQAQDNFPKTTTDKEHNMSVADEILKSQLPPPEGGGLMCD